MTTEVQEKPTLVLDGENYVIEDLSDKAKYLVRSVAGSSATSYSNSRKIRSD